MKRELSILAISLLTACTPTQSSRELNDRARASDRFAPAHTWSTPPSEIQDVEEKRKQEAIELEQEEKLRRRQQDLDRRY